MTSESTYAWDSTSYAWCVQAASTIQFVYDGWMLVAKVDGATGHMLQSYQWDPTQEAGVGGLLSETVYGEVNGTWQATATYVPVYDGNANVVGLVDKATGAIVSSYKYSTFGSVLSRTWSSLVADPNDILFSSHRYDAGTGLVYMNQRWYSPQLGRFLTPDPTGEGSDVNRYRYCFNNPVNGVDPTGLILGGDDLIYIGIGLLFLWAMSGCSPSSPAPVHPAKIKDAMDVLAHYSSVNKIASNCVDAKGGGRLILFVLTTSDLGMHSRVLGGSPYEEISINKKVLDEGDLATAFIIFAEFVHDVMDGPGKPDGQEAQDLLDEFRKQILTDPPPGTSPDELDWVKTHGLYPGATSPYVKKGGL